MAKTIAIARGEDNMRVKETHRLGSVGAWSEANTWRTFTECHVRADGSGWVQVRRDGVKLHMFEFGPEGDQATVGESEATVSA